MSEQKFLDDMVNALTKRLQALEMQAATFGLDTPPHISIEIEDIKQKIETTRLGAHSLLSADMINNMPPVERWKRLYDATWDIEIRIYAIEKELKNDRINIQSRHKEFNIAIQKVLFDNVSLWNNIHRLYIFIGFNFLITIVLIALTYFI